MKAFNFYTFHLYSYELLPPGREVSLPGEKWVIWRISWFPDRSGTAGVHGGYGLGEGVNIPVILCGIVAGSDVDTRAAVQIPHRSAQSGSRLQSGVNPGGDAVGGDDTGGFHGKQVAFDPAVVANGNGLGQGSGFQVIAQSLSWPADDINIHAVGAGADDAPQAAGSEFQIPVESVIDLLFVSFG